MTLFSAFSSSHHVVGLRILSIREMVFTLCLILILDTFFSTTTMPLADFWKNVPKMPVWAPQWNFKGQSLILLRTWINVNCIYLLKTKIAFFVMQSTVQCVFWIKMTATCLKMATKFKMAANIEFLYMNWLCGLIINIKTTPYYLTVTFYLHHGENITHNTCSQLILILEHIQHDHWRLPQCLILVYLPVLCSP